MLLKSYPPAPRKNLRAPLVIGFVIGCRAERTGWRKGMNSHAMNHDGEVRRGGAVEKNYELFFKH